MRHRSVFWTAQILGLFITVLSLHAQATIRCGDALMSSTVDGVEKVESTRLCVDDEQRANSKARVQAIASGNCRDDQGEKPCLAYAKAREAADLHDRPFTQCLKLGGEPQSIKFQMDALGSGVWHVTDRCRFDLDFSFLDTRSFTGQGPFRPR